MVKITSDEPPLQDSWWTTCIHDGAAEPWDPTALHWIWWYAIANFPPGASAAHIHAAEDTARSEAYAWLALPQIPRDLCTVCRIYAPGPTCPRWNIYRADNRLQVPQTILADYYDT